MRSTRPPPADLDGNLREKELEELNEAMERERGSVTDCPLGLSRLFPPHQACLLAADKAPHTVCIFVCVCMCVFVPVLGWRT